MDRENHIAALIASAHERADDALRRLAHRGEDRLEPMAVEWLRRWSPKPMLLVPADCGCAHGRCALCN